MNKTQISNPIVLLTFAAGLILLFLLGFAAWLSLPQARIDFGSLTLRQEGQPETLVLKSSKANAEGLAIYHQSERNLGTTFANTEGLAIYHQSERGLDSPGANAEGLAIYKMSEWGITPFAQANPVGLNIYWQSERHGVPLRSFEEGMAIYQQSERNLPLTRDNAEGFAIYHQVNSRGWR